MFNFVIIVIVIIDYISECNGYYLSSLPYNNLTRFKRQTSACRKRQFVCDNGQCIAIQKYCDGISDCADGSDEIENCNTNSRDGCNAPTIKNGKFTVFDVNYTPGSMIKESSFIKIECNSGYELSGNNFPRCVAGQWDKELPKCTPVIPASGECAIIPQIENGKYEVLGNSYVPGDPIPNFSVLTFTCFSDNYVLTTKYNLTYCVNGQIQNKLPKCVRSCAALFSTTTDVKCEFGGVEIDCSKKVREGTIATMKCKTDYVENSNGPQTAICLSGSWDVPLKRCFSASCPALISSHSTDVNCELNGVKYDCSKKVPDGTIATLKCRRHYVKLNPRPSKATCSRGNWDLPPEQCVPECGEVTPSAQILIALGTTAIRKGDFPWHVAIYSRKPHGRITYICGGSLINEKIVLSSAVCFTSHETGKLNTDSEYFVAAGKIYNQWDAEQDAVFNQKRKISKIEIPKEYLGYKSNYIGDIAVVVVEDPFILTNFIKPVCVDWDSVYVDQQLKDGVLGKVAGWGALPSDGEAINTPRSLLKELTVPFVESNKCLRTIPESFKKFLIHDKYCAGYANGTNLCVGDSGGGMVFRQDQTNKYFIQGIVSLSPSKRGSCDFDQLTLYTKVNSYISLISNVTYTNEKLYESKKPDECFPPVIQNGNYRVLSNNEFISYSAGKPIPNFSIINITCVNTNYVLSTPYSMIYCVGGKYSQEIPKCVLTCSPKFLSSIDVDCKLDGIKQDCTKDVYEGTIVYMKCKPNFIDNSPNITKSICLDNGLWDVPPKQCSSPYMCPPRSSIAIDVFCELNGVTQDCSKEVPDGTVARMKCKRNYVDVKNGPSIALCLNGAWSIPPKTCIPDCGQIVQEGQTYIVNGTSANRGEFPWHVAIYRQKPQEPLDYKCGGSIISVKIVISAAHCFTDPNNGNIYPISEFRVAAGKKYSRWDAQEDEYYVQKRNVTKILTPRDVYFGQLSNYAGDVAVVVVDKIFTLTNFIKPVCVDWNSEYTNEQIIDGTLGEIAGWGSSTTGNPIASVNLKKLSLPYVGRGRCVEIVPKHFIPFITVDKYCAGYTNGSSVCDGDSGGGMIFSRRNDYGVKEYYLQGIISAGPSKDGHCDDFQLGVYTKVKDYITFIKNFEESNRM